MQHHTSWINILNHPASLNLFLIFLFHILTAMLLSDHQFHYHHYCHSSNLKLIFSANDIYQLPTYCSLHHKNSSLHVPCMILCKYVSNVLLVFSVLLLFVLLFSASNVCYFLCWVRLPQYNKVYLLAYLLFPVTYSTRYSQQTATDFQTLAHWIVHLIFLVSLFNFHHMQCYAGSMLAFEYMCSIFSHILHNYLLNYIRHDYFSANVIKQNITLYAGYLCFALHQVRQ